VREKFIALLASLAMFMGAGAQALAGPYMSWGQWTSDPGVAFSQCWNRGAQALGSVGLSAVQDGRFFHGSDSVFTASLICYDLGNRFIVTITVAAELGGQSSMTTDQVRDRMSAVIFGSGGGATINLSGRYTCVGPCTSPNGTATIEQNGNDITFISEVGGRSRGRFLDATTVIADDWGGMRATISADGRTISWTNGVRWVRQ
jgi:hypothetical protein